MCQRRPAWLPGPATRPVSLSCIGCNASPCAAQRQLSALLSAFPPGATYNFAAQAINGAGSGPWSANVSLTTPIRWDACCCASASFSRAAVGCTHACMHARLPEAAGSVPVPASRETVACTSLHRPPPPSDGPSCRSLYRLAQAPRRPHHRAVHCKEPQPCFACWVPACLKPADETPCSRSLALACSAHHHHPPHLVHASIDGRAAPLWYWPAVQCEVWSRPVRTRHQVLLHRQGQQQCGPEPSQCSQELHHSQASPHARDSHLACGWAGAVAGPACPQTPDACMPLPPLQPTQRPDCLFCVSPSDLWRRACHRHNGEQRGPTDIHAPHPGPAHSCRQHSGQQERDRSRAGGVFCPGGAVVADLTRCRASCAAWCWCGHGGGTVQAPLPCTPDSLPYPGPVPGCHLCSLQLMFLFQPGFGTGLSLGTAYNITAFARNALGEGPGSPTYRFTTPPSSVP